MIFFKETSLQRGRENAQIRNERIKAETRQKILNALETWPPGRVTVRDFCKHAGVNISTLLRGHPDLAEEVKARSIESGCTGKPGNPNPVPNMDLGAAKRELRGDVLMRLHEAWVEHQPKTQTEWLKLAHVSSKTASQHWCKKFMSVLKGEEK